MLLNLHVCSKYTYIEFSKPYVSLGSLQCKQCGVEGGYTTCRKEGPASATHTWTTIPYHTIPYHTVPYHAATTTPYNTHTTSISHTIPYHMCTLPYPYTTSLVHPYLDHNFDSTMSKCIHLNSKLYCNIKSVIHMHSPNANVFKPKPLGQWCSQQQRNLKVHQYS